MKIEYDGSADAIYIYLIPEATNKKKRHGIVYQTGGDWPIHLDFTKDGRLVGIEIMDASKTINIDYLKKFKFERIDKKK